MACEDKAAGLGFKGTVLVAQRPASHGDEHGEGWILATKGVNDGQGFAAMINFTVLLSWGCWPT